jgi:2-succinyl-5-enolpyruvyl-6-hydroxy-3-cyclohexene-1-carboxylate synthase
MSDTALLNLRWALSLIDGLTSCGLEHVVISPGSRSTPLALASERHPAITTWIQVDERCAAFFALGLARSDGRPVAVLATSGSAPAHWYPAVIEASYSAVPLLLLSADRPPELQDCGANQTIDQTRLFGSQVRAFHQLPLPEEGNNHLDAVRQLSVLAGRDSLEALPGPVHINIPLREPLVPRVDSLPKPFSSATVQTITPRRPVPDDSLAGQLAAELRHGRGIIICGPEQYTPDFAAAVTALAERLGAPLLADPLSSLRFGHHALEHIITRYDSFLRHDQFSRNHCPDWVLRFGAFPVSKALAQFMESCESSTHYLVDAHGRNRDPLHRIGDAITADPAALCEALATRLKTVTERTWLEAFQRQEQRAADLAVKYPCSEAAIINACIEQLPNDSTLFSSNSLSIRDLDSFCGSGVKPLRIIANRGVSGIDGNLSTLLGLAAAHQRSANPGRILGLIGDLAFFHDMNGLLSAAQQDVLIILLNNGGGAIFNYLPQAALPEFKRDWLTPTQLDFAKAAELYRIRYHPVQTESDFALTLKQALLQKGPCIIEVSIDAQASLQQHRRYWDAVIAD